MKEYTAKDYKVVALREMPLPEQMHRCDTPDNAEAYWRACVASAPWFNPEVECFVALHLNTRKRIKGHHLVATGTLDTIHVHAREVFRAAIIGAAAAVIVMHNHPSGEASPSEADIKVTRDLIRQGQLLKIEVLDHVIIGAPPGEGRPRGYVSLRELGYFYGSP